MASLTLSLAYGQDAIHQKVEQHALLIQNSASYSPLEEVANSKLDNAIPSSILQQKQTLQIQKTPFQNIQNNKNKYLRIQVPIEGQNQELALMKADIFSPDFQAVAASNPDVPLSTDTGLHYWGTVNNQSNSLVCLSFFDGEMAGFINYDNNQYDLGKVQGSNFHVLYKKSDLNGYPGFTCDAISPDGVMPSTELVPVQKSLMAGCVRIHTEVDYSLYQDKGSNVTNVSNYVYALFAQTAILYANESINTDISYMKVWDTPSPYSASDPLGDLNNQNYGRTFGDLVHVIHTLSGGGVAYVDVLCNSSVNTGASGIFGSFSNIPTYSWDVEVLTHELGHNLGSPHTHSCSWNGNNTAIDGCGPAAGYNEGCPGSLPANGGTIMSYCHLTNVGIDFNFGFGQQPGDLIRNRVNNASCLSNCQCSDGVQNGDETGIDCGGSCPNACPTCTDGVLNGDEIGIDCGGSNCPACPPENCSTYGFNGTIYSFDPDQDFGTATVQDGGATLLVEGNVWKAIEINYTFTPNTVLEFDFKSTAQGEIHEISFDNDLVFASFNRVVVYGDQGYAGDYVITPYNGSGNFQHFVVPLGINGSVTYQYMVLSADDDLDANANSYFSNIQIYEDYDGNQSCGNGTSCNDGIQNGDETGVDCGGSCPPCYTCTDGIQNGNETGVDCGGPDCPACPTCFDGVQNGDETGIDCGGSCPTCVACDDGIQNGNETGVDCGGPDCPACPTCTDGILNGDEIGVDCGGSCPACPSENCTTYNFGSNTIYSFDAAQDFGTATVQDAGATLLVEGNVWKAVEVNYTLTPNTVIEFDFKSTAQGEIHEVAFDNDLLFAPTSRVVVYGDQGYAGDFVNPVYSGSGNFEHFIVNIGANFTGTFQYMVLTADDDADASANSYFRNIQIYEDYNGDQICGSGSTCTDGIQNGGETGIDCGGPDCPPCFQPVTLDICVFLEGVYDINSGAMGNTLQSMGVLSATQPYNASPWNYGGQEILTTGTGITDWVLVSLRTSTAKSSEIARAAGVLQTDGCIDFPNAADILPLGFNTPVYIVVEHRNHMGVMSAQAVSVSNDVLAHDFRAAQSYATPGTYGQKQMEDGVWCLFAGDIDPNDANSYDINGSDKSIWQNQNGTFDAYLPADLNQDSDINGADKGIWQSNNGTFSAVPK